MANNNEMQLYNWYSHASIMKQWLAGYGYMCVDVDVKRKLFSNYCPLWGFNEAKINVYIELK